MRCKFVKLILCVCIFNLQIYIYFCICMHHSFLHPFLLLLSAYLGLMNKMLHFLHFRSECWLHCIRHVRTGALQKPVGTLLQRLPGQIYSYTKPFQCVRVFSRGPQWRVFMFFWLLITSSFCSAVQGINRWNFLRAELISIWENSLNHGCSFDQVKKIFNMEILSILHYKLRSKPWNSLN